MSLIRRQFSRICVLRFSGAFSFDYIHIFLGNLAGQEVLCL